MLKAVIVDDEIASIDSLEILLKNIDANVEVCGKASNIEEAKTVINKKKPDLVFLDIEMPNGSGFDLLDSFEDIAFEVIFVTAYNHYAIKAFKYAAVDYILKPVDINTLQSAIERVSKNRQETTKTKISALYENLRNDPPKKITLASSESIEIVSTDDIIQFEAEGSYTKVFIKNTKPVIVSKSIKEFEDTLASDLFFRCHKSHLINMNHIKKVVKNQNFVEMIDTSKAYISRRKKVIFFDAINEFIGK